MKKWITAGLKVLPLVLILAGCTRYEPAGEMTREETEQAETEWGETDWEETEQAESEQEEAEGEDSAVLEDDPIILYSEPERVPVKVKGIYVSAHVAGIDSMMDQIIRQIDETELNAVVIDVKDDNGRITFQMDSPVVAETEACEILIQDMPALMARLEAHEIYPIARVVAFRDPYLAERKPEWSLHRADGSIYRDSQGLAWVNPYKKEVWDYLIEIGKEAGKAGFKEIQFDYIRFAVDRTMKDVVYDEEDVRGRNKTEVIAEFTAYAGEALKEEGLFVSADVFGAIIKSQEDADAVGQDYAAMAGILDYICPMIYPSHYGDGNFGIAHPDQAPYDTVYQALLGSKEKLGNGVENLKVRPWLQDFTASYLKHYIPYGDEEVRRQIQAVYDAGYEEWILWDAGVSYHYGGLLREKMPLEGEE